MILPDVNVLVYAYRLESAFHDDYAAWLTSVVQGADDLALVEPVLVGFVRIVTNGRVWTDPAPTTHAIEFVDAMRRGRRLRWLPTTNATWQRFSAIAGADPHVRGNLVPDAWLAAQALAHGCRLATADRGFARFEGLDWFDPVAL